MRKFIVALGSIALSAAAPAQQLLQCVNPDVLNSLVFNGRAEAKLVISRTLPADANGFRAPAGFTLIGSGVRGLDSRSTVVAYKTTLETSAALDRLLEFMATEGWGREAEPPLPAPVISVAGQASTTAMLCRNGERRNVRVQENNGARYAIITGFETRPPRACGVPAQQPAFVNPAATIAAARAQLPQFSFPESVRMDGEIPGGGMSSSVVRIQSPDSAASLSRHLARQLVEQGWRSDAEWNGRLSTGSTWSRRNPDGQTLWGTLEILSRGGAVYDVGYSLAAGP